MEKVCKHCGEFKNLTDFYPDIRNSDGLFTHCIPCHIKANKARRKQKPKAEKAVVKIESVAEGKKVCTCCNAEKPADEKHFHSHPSTKDKLQSRCIPCSSKDSAKSKRKRSRYYSKMYLI
jgi:hypothetical protein